MNARSLRAPLAALTLSLLAAAPHARAGTSDGWSQQGEASFYSSAFRGRRTSSGARYDDTAMTAAHPTLPLGTRVRVTDEYSGRSVVVTINDRQPAHGHRVLDLSRAAAAQLGIIGRGRAMVQIDQVSPDEPVEVAEAPDPADGLDAGDAVSRPALSRRHGRPHTRHVVRSAASHPRSNLVRSATLIRHSAPHPATPRSL